MVLIGFPYEPLSLDLYVVCFEEEQDIPNTRDKKVKVLLKGVDVRNGTKCTQMLST